MTLPKISLVPRAPAEGPVRAAGAGHGRLEAGTEAGIDAIYREHAETIGRWVARLGGPRADVEDIVHEVFLIVHRKLEAFRGEARLTTWLYRITEKVVRRRRRKDRLYSLLGVGAGAGGHADAVSEAAVAFGRVRSPALDQSQELERAQEIALVYRVLDRLSEADRSLLILFEIEDLSGEAVSAMLDLRPSVVWVRLHRARRRFLAALKKEERA